MKGKIKIALGVVVSVGLLAFVASLVEWDKVRAHLGELRWPVFISLIGITVVHFVARSVRWRLLLPDQER